jgi:integrase
MRRWVRLGISRDFMLEFGGRPIKRISKAFAAAANDAELSHANGKVTPHTLRHTAATWLMQRGVDPWVAAGYLGMTVETLLEHYGHHHPDHLSQAREAFENMGPVRDRMRGRKREQTSVNVVDLVNHPKATTA